ncbi:hypothetical protein GXP70_01585 [Paenibacillus lycopersici]|uniref:DUF3895 domain-containing protein n=1 Tax=Paenibacillus lycopersici TaxID=2704462 RepID=A0A6C0FNW5_9BACL|nr:hypothetical protein [Paenibacillus lycopersici]QHT58798.1 hypothetical protein GXP70_01585 [Paenibacillus lycopersici]
MKTMTIEERDRILATMNDEQRHFIHHTLERGRKTVFARLLAKRKSQFIPDDATYEEVEAFLDEWDYLGFTDGGAVSAATRCECGHPLRYQHHVFHRPTNTTRHFGITHLQMHTGIDAKTITAIQAGFDVLDEEMNEIIVKFRDGWQLADAVFLPLPEGLELPGDMQAHLNIGLPLLARQALRLRNKIRQHTSERETAKQASGTSATRSSLNRLYETPSGISAENDQFSLLFDELPSPGQAALEAVRSSDPLFLPPAAREVVDRALGMRMRISAAAVCESLIERRLADDTRFLSGKPHIHTAVSAYLDLQVEAGKARLLERSWEDRIYIGL